MGSKNKLKRFKENEKFPNVFQPTREILVKNKFSLKGHWCDEFFKNNHPLVLELGCGKGEYTVGLAERDPNKNYIGIDIKGARFWRGAKTAQENKLSNDVNIFVNKLNQKFSDIEILKFDERFTSIIAKKTILQSGISKMKRRNKILVDKVSATIILQDYISSLE